MDWLNEDAHSSDSDHDSADTSKRALKATLRHKGSKVLLRYDIELDLVSDILVVGQRFSSKELAVEAIRCHGAKVKRVYKSWKSDARRVIYWFIFNLFEAFKF
jgi:hypothetical protein